MARSTKAPAIDSTIAKLQQQIDEEAGRLGTLETDRRRALIAVAQEQEGAEADAQRFAAEIRERRDHLQALRGALDDARQAQGAIAADAVVAEARQERDKLKGQVRPVRAAADAVNAACDSVGAATFKLREACKLLWEMADGGTRREELGELPRLIGSLPAIINERLAFHSVVASRMPLLDRSSPPPCVGQFFDVSLDLIAPGPGRPKKPGADQAPAGTPTTEQEIAA